MLLNLCMVAVLESSGLVVLATTVSQHSKLSQALG